MATGGDVDWEEKPKDQDSTPTPGAGQVCTDGTMSVGVYCWNRSWQIRAVMDLLQHIYDTYDSDTLEFVFPDDESIWKRADGYSSVVIICPSQTFEAPEDSLRRFLDSCFTTHGPENMMVVITDLEDTESEKRRIAEWKDGDYPQCPLVTLTEAEMDVIGTSDTDDVSAERRMAKKVNRIREILGFCAGSSGNALQQREILKEEKKAVIGIFSREADCQYSWLVDLLRSDVFRDDIAEVQRCCISNSGRQQFYQDASQCTFGILYHTKNRGRINVTDVNGSLYDEELEHLSSRLGKKKVIVVIDDLSDSSDQQKINILENQPSINNMAEDLFLIRHMEKTSSYQRRLMVDREQMRRKLQTLMKNIGKGENDNHYTKPQPDKMATRDNVDCEEIPKVEDSTPTPSAGRVCTDRTTSVGVVCWGRKQQITALRDLLPDIYDSYSLVYVSPDDESIWKCVNRFSQVVIICPSQIFEAPEDSLRRFLDSCFNNTHGSENMMVVITDVEDTESEKKIIEEWKKGKYSRCSLVTLTEAEMDLIITLDVADVSAERMVKKVTHMKEILQSSAGSTGYMLQQREKKTNKAIIGIFSREADSQYSWLVDLLRSDVFMDDIADVWHCRISNSRRQQFHQDVSWCTFGILYHSKNGGRIDVTEVDASLYDEELKHLSSRLGKKKVIVVIDDLSDSSEQQKTSILRNQPSIKKMAKDLFLISAEEKTSSYLRRLMVDREQVRKKLQMVIEKIGKKKNGNHDKETCPDKTTTKDVDWEEMPTDEDSTPIPGAGRACTDGTKHLGVFCWCTNWHILALMDFLRGIYDSCDSVSILPGSPDDESAWKCADGYSSVVIICPSQTFEAPEDSLRRFLNSCFTTHGPENMMVVITDVEDTESEKTRIAEWKEGEYPRCPLVTLTEAKMDVISTSDTAIVSAERRMVKKVTHMREILQLGAERFGIGLQQREIPKEENKAIIGIFSREADCHYSWLKQLLRSDVFIDDIAGVRPCCISNSGRQQFYEDVSWCTFGILYHTKNRGRINVTDVTDSLYDKELEYLSSRLGKKKVIVVIDDVSDSSDQQKTNILRNQPSINNMAEDLFLISAEEKTSSYQRRLMVDRDQVKRKLQMLIEKMRQRKNDADSKEGSCEKRFGTEI